MTCTIEHLTSILRLGDDPYTHALTIRWLSPTRCEVMGLDKPLSVAQVREIKRCLAEQGLREAVIQRVRDGRLESHVLRANSHEKSLQGGSTNGEGPTKF